jgi:sugar lactone lactonase YvrE
MAYDDVHGKVYFSDFYTRLEGKIWSVNLDGSELTELASNLIEPYAVALDVAHGKVYWADDMDDDSDVVVPGKIYRANLDGSDSEVIVTMDDAQFRAIALDLKNGKMYFNDVNNEDFYMAELDGSGATPILSGVYGYAMFVDTKHDKLYFDEQNAEELQRANLDGTNVETVDDNGTRIYGIAMDQEKDKLYWSGRDSGTIEESDMDGGNQVTLKSGLASPRGIFLRK